MQRLHFVVVVSLAMSVSACKPGGVGLDETSDAADEVDEEPTSSSSEGESSSEGGTPSPDSTESADTDAMDTIGADTTESDSTGTDTGETSMNNCPENDAWEDNDMSDSASMLTWDSIHIGESAKVSLGADMCSGEDDWYYLPVGAIGLDPEVVGSPYLHINSWIESVSFCDGACGLMEVPSGPEVAMTIEVFDAETLQLRATNTVMAGGVEMFDTDPIYAKDLLIHVFGPTPEATYDYYLSVEIDLWNDCCDCEC